ncbi:MAG TPA: hypothetical protein VJN43_01700 [Bryobacteraceae bacterium]|nr:hypothetical protein [Bryobacteraceae bacterium]
MRGFVSSLFCLSVAVISMILLAAGTHWLATRQLGQLDGILLFTACLLAAVVFACRFRFADFEPLSITRGTPSLQLD